MPKSSHAERTPKSMFWVAWANTVLRLRWLLLLLLVGFTAYLGHQGAKKTIVDMSVESFLSEDSEAARVLEELRDDFGRVGATSVLGSTGERPIASL